MRRPVIFLVFINISTICLALPGIEVIPADLNFEALEAGTNPTPQSISIINTGTGKLEWQITESCPWLYVTPISGSCIDETDIVTVGVDITGLAGGTYTSQLTITDPDAANSPQYVTVTLEITGPIMEVSPTSIIFYAVEGEPNPDPQTFTIQNTGGGFVNWSADYECDWLDVSPTSGSIAAGDSMQVTLSVDPVSLSDGYYSFVLSITDPDVAGSPQRISITLRITGPTLYVWPVTIDFSAAEGQPNPAPQSITIRNTGEGILNWTADYQSDWLIVNPSSGFLAKGESMPITLSADITSLTGISYSCQIIISDPLASNSPQTVTANLSINKTTFFVPSLDFPTIQSAIDASDDGDIIFVSDGIYTGEGNRDIYFNGKAITVRGNVNDPNLVIIDCQGSELYKHSAFSFRNYEEADSVLEGFTITNGYKSYGGAISCYGSSPTINNCIFSYNSATNGDYPVYGGAVYCNNSNVTINNSIFSNNSAASLSPYVYGGAVCCNGGNPTINNCIFCNNSAISPSISVKGGAVYFTGSNPTINSCTFTGNSAGRSGGGIHNDSSNALITNCSFINNFAGYYGGGMYNDSSSALITNCSFINNSTESGGGGGMYNYSSNPVVNYCTFTDNSADNSSGGGIYNALCNPTIINTTFTSNFTEFSGGAIYNNYCDSVITNCKFSGNISNDNSGGIFNRYMSSKISNCIFNDNISGDQGGAMSNFYCDLTTIINCMFSCNTAESDGGGIYNYDSNTIITSSVFFENSALLHSGAICNLLGNSIVTNCTLNENSAGYWGGGMCILNNNLNATNCIIWNNDPVQFYVNDDSQATVSYSDIQGGWKGTGNIDADPNFIDDYHLSPYSPCVNTGDPSLTFDPNETDIDGNLRVIGGRIDIGAYEVSTDNNFLFVSTNTINFSAIEEWNNPSPQNCDISNLCINEELNWSINHECSWLEVTPTEGATYHIEPDTITVSADTTGLAQGIYNCQITVSDPDALNSPQIIDISLEIIGPAILLNSNEFAFTASKETLVADPQILTIQYEPITGGTFNWQITEDCPWLTVDPMSGVSTTEINEVVLSVDPLQAQYGLNVCEFTVSDPQASNSPQVITVTLDVLGPELEVSPESFSFECDVNDPNTMSKLLSISNAGYDTLNWQISEDCPWLTVEPVSGISTPDEPADVIVTPDPEGLEFGIYTTELTVSDPVADNNPVIIPVSLHVYVPGEIHVPAEYATIQEAVDVSVEGDHVIIHPGTYSGVGNSGVEFNDKPITVRSTDPTNPEIVASTIIKGIYELLWQFRTDNDRNTTVDGLTFTQFNGPIITCYESSPTIQNCVFRDNIISQWPPYLIYCFESGARIINCDITGNNTSFGGSLFVYNPETGRTVTIDNCMISNRYLSPPYYYCLPSIHIAFCSAEITNTTVAFNTRDEASEYDPMFYPGVHVFCADVSIRNSIIWGNRGIDTTQVSVVQSSIQYEYPGPAILDLSYSDIEGGLDNVMIFHDDLSFNNFLEDGILPDPNLVDPNGIIWGQGNINVDPLFARYPNDGGDGWMDDRTTIGINEALNNDYGDMHLKSEAGRYLWEGFSKADFNKDKEVNLADFVVISEHWLEIDQLYPFEDWDFDHSWIVDIGDLMIFCEDYLQKRIFGEWIIDDVTSPCIDAGDPADTNYQNEPTPNGGIINMGAYGGTDQASKSIQ